MFLLDAFTPFETPPPTPFNVALSANGATASASSATINAAPSIAINGVRHTTGSWSGNGYASRNMPSVEVPVDFEVDFGQSRTISELRAYSLSSTLGVSYATDPSDTDTTIYAVIDGQFDYWNGSAWVTLDSWAGNNLTLRTTTFSPVVTEKVRLRCTQGGDLRLFMVEFEALGY